MNKFRGDAAIVKYESYNADAQNAKNEMRKEKQKRQENPKKIGHGMSFGFDKINKTI